jgi:hypothetical protein
MKNIRYGLIVVAILFCMVTSATAGVNIGIGLPNVSIGINLPLYPELVVMPGYPVYYAPQVDANYFFYDGMYWVYQNDNWYASSWYNGPWGIVQPYYVPLFILRIPVSYYRQPPAYFRGWQSNAPPRWGQHWGRDWEQHRTGWDKWKRASVPAPAPLPAYQQKYSGDRYPKVEQQNTLRKQQYRYQPREKLIQQHFKQVEQKSLAPASQSVKHGAAPEKKQNLQRSAPNQQVIPSTPHVQPQRDKGEIVRKSAPAQAPPQQRGPAAQEQRAKPAPVQREQHAPSQQERGEVQGGHGQEPRNDEEHGQGRNK